MTPISSQTAGGGGDPGLDDSSPTALPVGGGGWRPSRPQGAKARARSRCAHQAELGQHCRPPHASLHQSLNPGH